MCHRCFKVLCNCTRNYIKYYIKNENGKTKDYKKYFVILLNFSAPDMKQQRRKIEQQTKNEIKEKEAKKF